ncbi:MAG TPA: hypothetical protein VIL65_05245 [Beijerinckiaceae bacterium]|jgi:hypothetical protein
MSVGPTGPYDPQPQPDQPVINPVPPGNNPLEIPVERPSESPAPSPSQPPSTNPLPPEIPGAPSA